MKCCLAQLRHLTLDSRRTSTFRTRTFKIKPFHCAWRPLSKWATWESEARDPLSKAAALATEQFPDQLSGFEDVVQPLDVEDKKVQEVTLAGVFRRIPQVPSADDYIEAAFRKANRLQGNKKIKGKVQHARNLSARKLDTLTKELSVPLGSIIKGFPTCSRMHPFERALLDLTVGADLYEKRLQQLDSLRKSCLQVGKSYAGKANKGVTVREVQSTLEEGFQTLEGLCNKGCGVLDSVKHLAITLRKLPTVDMNIPTIALVGAPNVGKSSLVQLLSSGMPEICDYPFTTRTVKMGHFYVDGNRRQVTDTPGLLNREEKDRNKMELLTLACLTYLPTAIVFVMDLTGDCGTKPVDQWQIRLAIKEQFPQKAWVDVFSKADLLQSVFEAAGNQSQSLIEDDEGPSGAVNSVEIARHMPAAVRVSSVEELGVDDLKSTILTSLQTLAETSLQS